VTVDATFPFKNPDIGWRMADHKVAVTSEFVRIKSTKSSKYLVKAVGNKKKSQGCGKQRYGDMTKGNL
jgi:hypothetical protein